MKKIQFILVFALTLAFTQSCNEDGLELTNPNALSPDTFFQSEAQVQSSVNAIYANLQTRGLYARHMFFMMDNFAHENGGNTQLEADKLQYLNFSVDASHGATRAYWESCYRGINKANFVIGNEEKINAIPDSQLSTERKAKFVGEAKFLRGLYYFFLVTRFGDVPLITVIQEDSSGFPRAPKADVWAQIITDLTDASNTLLAKGAEDSGRATRGAAQALLGKTYLYLEQYENALTAFNSLSGYDLETDFYDNFKEETEHGIESIFEVEYDDDLSDTAKWNSDASGVGPDEVTFRGQEYGFRDWYNVFPSDDLLNEYEAGDIRFEETFYVNGDIVESTGEVIDAFPSNNGGNAGWRKYQNYYKDANEDQASGINMKVIRYADVLLMMAEAESMRPGGSQDVAAGYIDRVRERAGLGSIGTELSQSQLFDALVHERKVELAGEQVRFNDIIRWGIAAQELSDTNFVEGIHELSPIPNNEISSNEMITPADQNPGY